MKNVVLIGDSIRLNYQHVVVRELKNIADVSYTADNNRFAKYTLAYLGDMLAQHGDADVVHWNNGIWDCMRFTPNTEPLTPLSEYLADMCRIFDEISYYCPKAQIVFATTTPILPYDDSDPTRQIFNRDIDRYNAAVTPILRARGAVINDLGSLLSCAPQRYISDDRIHLSDAGKEASGVQSANIIRALL